MENANFTTWTLFKLVLHVGNVKVNLKVKVIPRSSCKCFLLAGAMRVFDWKASCIAHDIIRAVV